MVCYRLDHCGILGRGVIGGIETEVIDGEWDKTLRCKIAWCDNLGMIQRKGLSRLRPPPQDGLLLPEEFGVVGNFCHRTTSIIFAGESPLFCETAPRALLSTKYQLPVFRGKRTSPRWIPNILAG